MSKVIEDKLDRIPVIRNLAGVSKTIILPGFKGLSLYDLLELYVYGIVKGTFTTRAGSIAFSFFMALFPFLLFVLNLIPFVWFIKDFQTRLLNYINRFLPPQTHELFDKVFLDIANTPRSGLLSFVFILSIILMTNGINGIFTGFEHSWHIGKNRTVVRQYFVAMGVAIIIAFLLLVTVITTIYLTYIIEDLRAAGLFSDSIFWIEAARYIIFSFMIYNVVATLYYFGTHEGRESKYFSIGALFTTILVLVFTYFFSMYIQNFSSYNKLYGSIGALVIAMVYTWLNSNILLLGFELNGSIQKLKKTKNADDKLKKSAKIYSSN